MGAHALLMAFNVFGVRTWDAGKGGVDGRLLGIRVRVCLLEAVAAANFIAASSTAWLCLKVCCLRYGIATLLACQCSMSQSVRSADGEVHIGGW